MLPAGTAFYQTADDATPGGRIEVLTEAPVALSLARHDCLVVPVRLLMAQVPVRAGDTLRARRPLAGLKQEVTVVHAFD